MTTANSTAAYRARAARGQSTSAVTRHGHRPFLFIDGLKQTLDCELFLDCVSTERLSAWWLIFVAEMSQGGRKRPRLLAYQFTFQKESVLVGVE
ncbi:MAG: hypothetical protein WA453_00985, partial [Methyloceanibacter sp.]